MPQYVFQREQIVRRPHGDVFGFFADPRNLQAITPDWLHFQILTPTPIDMRPGTLIEYRIRWGIVPMRWTTLIEEWQPPCRFVDTQVKGPYSAWRHEHLFESVPEGTKVTDVVRYALPLGPLGRFVQRLSVRRDLERIFDHRQSMIERLLEGNETEGGARS